MRTLTGSLLGEMLNERELMGADVQTFLALRGICIPEKMMYYYIRSDNPQYKDPAVWEKIFELIELAGVCWHGEQEPTEEQQQRIKAAHRRSKDDRFKVRSEALAALGLTRHRPLRWY